MKKRLLSLALALVLLTTAVAASTAGTAEDPLVSLSWAKTWASQVVAAASGRAKSDLKDFGTAAISASRSYAVAMPRAYQLTTGGTMTLPAGCSMTLSSGSAKITSRTGTLVNATAGSTVSGGELSVGSRYIVCEDSTVTVTAASPSVILACGTVTTTGTQIFTDVRPEDWFFAAVGRGVTLGLLNGMTDTTYEPNKTLSRAEAITLAARIHSLHTAGNADIPASGTAWYDRYRSYCIAQGVIDSSYGQYTADQMNAAVTRGEFVNILYHALPASAYTAINAIPDGAIPDVAMSDSLAGEIYAMYRAGILTGYSGTPPYPDHAFGASSNIRRSEVAVIVVRMMEADSRVSFTI